MRVVLVTHRPSNVVVKVCENRESFEEWVESEENMWSKDQLKVRSWNVREVQG